MILGLLIYYIAPAAVFAFAISGCMLLLLDYGVGLRGRRICWVAMVTLLLSPMVVPGGVIFSAFVPNGAILLGASLAYYLEFPLFGLVSFSVTSAFASIAARRCVVRLRSDAVPSMRRRRLVVIPIGIVAMVSCLYLLAYAPPEEIPAHIDKALIETQYGRLMDEVIRLKQTEESPGLEPLRQEFEADTAVLRVVYFNRGEQVLFQRGRVDGFSCSGTASGKWKTGLMLCSWGPLFFGDRALQYERWDSYPPAERMVLHLDYDELLERFPGEKD